MDGINLIIAGLRWKLIELLGLDAERAECVERAIVTEWEARGYGGPFAWKIPEPDALTNRAATIYIGAFYDAGRRSERFAAPSRVDDFDGKTVWEWKPTDEATAEPVIPGVET